MGDIKLQEDDDGIYDIQIENGSIVEDNGLGTSLFVSILSDGRADSSQVPIPERRRGWMGDTVTPFPGLTYGSTVWLFEQSALTENTINGTEDEIRKSLQWMIDTGLSIKNEVTVIKSGVSNLNAIIKITSPDGGSTEKSFNLWKETVNGS